MKDLYVLIDDSEILKYNGEILKRVIDNKVVKVISNPTEDDLKEFGYMELVNEENIPEYDPNTQIIETFYKIKDDKIYQDYKIINNEDINDVELDNNIVESNINNN